MSSARYFPTDEAEKVRRYDMRQKGLQLKAHLATLEAELQEYSVAWGNLSSRFSEYQHDTFRVTGDTIEVVRPVINDRPLPGHAPKINKICSVPAWRFPEQFVTLLADLELAKQEFADISRQLKEQGDPL